MNTEELLIVERGRWVSADRLWVEPDDGPTRLRQAPKPMRQCQGACRKKLAPVMFEGVGGRQQTVCIDCREQAKAGRDARKRVVAVELKVCTACGFEKPLTAFFWLDCRVHALGRRDQCGTCSRRAVVGAWRIGA
jgi:hypothetical protein